MSPNTAPRSTRRNARTFAIGAVALTAAVALPAFAIDRGGDGAVDVATAADAVESSTTTTTTIDPALAAWLDAQAVNESLAALSTLTPEQLFELQTRDWTPEQRASFAELAQQQAELESFYALVSWSTAQAEAQAQAKAQTSRSASAPAVSSGSVWDRLAQCETGGNWAHPTVSGGFSGGLMFHYATWNANGGQAYAATASGATREQQIVVAERILASSGWGAWPGCSRKLGLR